MNKTTKGIAALALLLVICWTVIPASHSHSSDREAAVHNDAAESGITWYCSMTQCGVSGMAHPGKCPKCGMDLIPTDASAPKTGPREVAFMADAARLVRVETAVAKRQPVTARVSLSGKVAEDETRRSIISARFDGRIERLFMDHTGLRVRKGDHMADIYAPDLTLSLSTILQAKNNTSDYAVLGPQEIEDTRIRLINRGLTNEQIDELIESGAMRSVFMITSPVSGVVVERLATRGQYVNEGTPLYTIADLSRVWVELDAHEQDLALIRFGQEASLAIAAFPGERFQGVVSFIDPVMDESTRTVRVRLDVPNPQYRLKPGMLVRADIDVPLTDDGIAASRDWADAFVCPMHPMESSGEKDRCPVCEMSMVPAETLATHASVPPGQPLVVPDSAVLSTGRRHLVYLAKPMQDGIARYVAREVNPGLTAGPMRVILSGLEEGDVVVTAGAFQIDSAMQIQGKYSLMQAGGIEDGDPYAGEGGHDGDPAPGWYAAGQRSEWDPRSVYPGYDAAAILHDYEAIAAALANDDPDAARTGAAGFGHTVDRIGTPSGSVVDEDFPATIETLRETTSRLEKSTSLDDQRLAFRTLSGAVTFLARRYGLGSTPVRSIFCPMAFSDTGAFWLQIEPKVNNPYHGQEMLRCGWEVEGIGGR